MKLFWKKKLKDSVTQKSTLLQDVEVRIENMDKQIQFYKSFILTDEKFVSKIKENRFYVPEGCK